MHKNLIVDASDSDCPLMSGLLTRAGYEPMARPYLLYLQLQRKG